MFTGGWMGRGGHVLARAHCNRVARYKVPKKVELVEALPVSAAGKILKRELREWALAADARA